MAAAELYPCFGFEFFGMCEYDPQAPSSSYFTIGDAVAALAFTLAVQQFLKPIYQFRLRAMGVNFSHILYAVFVGAFFTVIAAAVPSMTVMRGTPLSYPVIWEITGGLVIGVAYATVAWISLRPAIVKKRNVSDLARGGVMLLSEATDDDRSMFAKDILSGSNIETLVEIAAEFERAEMHAVSIKFEELRKQGKESEGVRGRQPISSFYAFARRRQLKQASYARHLLQLMSERAFCRVVIARHPWRFLQAIVPIAEKNTAVNAAKPFVQSIAWQSLVHEEGMLAREDSYEGFGVTRGFSKRFFGDHKMSVFEPLRGISSIGTGIPSDKFVSRLNIVSELMVSAEIKHRGFWSFSSLSSVTVLYERICHEVDFARFKDQKPPYLSDLRRGIVQLARITADALENCPPSNYNHLFASQSGRNGHDIVDETAKLVCEGLGCIANDFKGFEDSAWMFALNILDSVFERYGDNAVGLSPLQQAVAIRLVEQLEQNLKGCYPTVSRVLLAIIGPYNTSAPEKPGSATSILKDAVYCKLKRLPDLYEKNPDKAIELLPANISYDHTLRVLTHTYSDGKQVDTALGELQIEEVDLLAERNRRKR